MEYSYVDLLVMLLDSLESDTTMPDEVKSNCGELVLMLIRMLWPYSA